MTVNATVTAMMVHIDMLLQISALHQISVPHQILALHPLLILMLEIILIMIQGAECSQGTGELVTTTTHWNRYCAVASPEENVCMSPGLSLPVLLPEHFHHVLQVH